MPISSQSDIQAAIKKAQDAGYNVQDILTSPDVPNSIKDYINKTQGAQAQAPATGWNALGIREGEIGLGNLAAGAFSWPARLGLPFPTGQTLQGFLPQPNTPEEHALAAGSYAAGVASPAMLLGPEIGLPVMAGAAGGAATQEEVARRPPFKSDLANEALGLGGGFIAGGGLAGLAGKAAGLGGTAATAGGSMSAGAHGAVGTIAAELSEVAMRHFGLPPGLSQLASVPIGVLTAMMGRGGSVPFSQLGGAAGLTSSMLSGPPPAGAFPYNPLLPNVP